MIKAEMDIGRLKTKLGHVSTSGNSRLACFMTKTKGFYHIIRRCRLIKMIKTETELGGLKNKLRFLSASSNFFS